VFQQWSLEQRPDPGALDGYEIDIEYKQILIDTEKSKTVWERIIAMRVLNHEPPASILPRLASIDDQHEKAQAIKTLMASLRTGSLPPHPFRLSVSSGSAPLDIMTTPSFVPAPAVISSDPATRSTVIVPTAPPKPPLSAQDKKTLEAQWRGYLESARKPVVKTLDDLTVTASTLDDGADKADVYLAIADAYTQALETGKALDSTNNAAISLAAAHQRDHGFFARWSAWIRTTGFPYAVAVLAFLFMLTRELWTKLFTHYAGTWFTNRLNSGELAVALGVPAPRNRLILPDGATTTEPS
jgi:hypothetical protein